MFIRILTAGVAVGLALFSSAGSASAQSAPSQTSVADTTLRVVGYVAEADFETPVRARVSVAGIPNVTVITTDQGRYVIRGLPAGVHTLDIRALGYEPRSVEVAVPDSGVVQVNVLMTRLAQYGMPVALAKRVVPAPVGPVVAEKKNVVASESR